ncbi:MAG: response regulator transcription factor [Pseudomonadota bacterium]
MTRVLVADDHVAVRVTYAEYLDACDGLRVVGSVENGLDAVEFCRGEAPDVVLMDVRMPVMDGIEATRLIKRDAPATTVVLVSAYEEDDLVESGRRAGADAFVLKGVSGAELAGQIRELAACDA